MNIDARLHRIVAAQESPRRVKPLLYVYRVLLTGIHLMKTGEIQPNLVTLNEEFRLPFLPELMARKTKGENDVDGCGPGILRDRISTAAG